MTEAIAFQRPTAVALPWRLVRLLPGVALLFSIGYAGKLSEALLRDYGKAHHLALPNIEYVLWAIVFGMVIANTVGVAQVFRPGVATYDFWLKAGIVLLGARFLLVDVLNPAEAAAAGAIFSDAAGKIAVLTKSTRNAMIGFVVLAYAIYWASRGQAKAVEGKAAFLWQKFPTFVLGFLFVSLLATFQVFDKAQIASLANLSRC